MAEKFSVEAIISAVDKNFGSTIDRLTGAVSKFSAVGNKVVNGVGASFGRMFSAMALANVATAGITALSGGMSSLVSDAMSASDAMDKFRNTLSFAGKTGEETERASLFVKKYADDTVYELSDISNTTAKLAANGIGNFMELTEAAGNLNAVAGGNRNTFKSVALALTQITGAGKLTTENWNQITNAIPGASGKLQEAMLKNGAYTGNFRDAMARGQITAEEFNQAILDIGMTDVAREAATSTQTIEGAIGNMQAGIVSKVMEMIGIIGKENITGFIGGLGDVIGSALVKIGNFAVFVKDNWSTIASVLKVVAGVMVGFKAVMTFSTIVMEVKKFVQAIGLVKVGLQAFGGALSFLMSPLGLIAVAIVAVVGVLVYLWNTNEGFRNAVIVIWEAIKVAFVTAWDFIRSAWNGAVEFFAALWEGIKATAMTFVGWIQGIWTGVTAAVGFMVDAVIGFFTGLWTQAGVVWQGIVDVISSVLSAYLPIFSAIWDGFKAALEIVWNLIKGIVEVAINYVKGVIDAVMMALSGDWEGAWNRVKEVVVTAWESIKSLVGNAINALWENIKSVWNSIFSTVSGVMDSIFSTVSGVWNSIVSAVSGFMDSIFSFVSNGWNSVVSFLNGIDLFGAGVAIIQGFLNGLVSMWNSVQGFVSGIANWIRENKGPISYDRKLLIPAGEAIMGGFNSSLASGFREVQSNVSSMGARLQSDFGVTSSLNARVETDVKPILINVALAGREFETFVDDVTSMQNRKDSVRLKYV